MPRLLSVNVGLPRDIAWQGKTVHTAVWKTQVQGRRMVRRLNVDGDGQGDLAGHGGEHRAVFVYQIESYRYWQLQLEQYVHFYVVTHSSLLPPTSNDRTIHRPISTCWPTGAWRAWEANQAKASSASPSRKRSMPNWYSASSTGISERAGRWRQAVPAKPAGAPGHHFPTDQTVPAEHRLRHRDGHLAMTATPEQLEEHVPVRLVAKRQAVQVPGFCVRAPRAAGFGLDQRPVAGQQPPGDPGPRIGSGRDQAAGPQAGGQTVVVEDPTRGGQQRRPIVEGDQKQFSPWRA